MSILLILFLGQCVFAVIVIFILKKLLDRELMGAALEKFESCKMSPDVKEIIVRSATNVSDECKSHLESIRQRKMPQASLNFQKDAAIKGGIIIAAGDFFLDFSLLNRLQHFWS